MSEKNEFIPEISINNTKEEKIVEVDGVEQKVEIPAKEGFNIKTKDLEGRYSKNFFLEEMEGIILLDRYQIQSKYEVKPMYISNEFEFTGARNNVRVYCPSEKEVKYEGPYNGAKDHFATGQITSAGRAETSYDVFSILYTLVGGEVFRFRWKMNQNNNWFDYKDGCKEDKASREDKKEYRGILTKFGLSQKKFGSNEFWACTLQNIGKESRKEADEIGTELENKMDQRDADYRKRDQEKSNHTEETKEEIKVENIPF